MALPRFTKENKDEQNKFSKLGDSAGMTQNVLSSSAHAVPADPDEELYATDNATDSDELELGSTMLEDATEAPSKKHGPSAERYFLDNDEQENRL